MRIVHTLPKSLHFQIRINCDDDVHFAVSSKCEVLGGATISWYDRRILPLWSDMSKIGQKTCLNKTFTWSDWSQNITLIWGLGLPSILWSSIKIGCKRQLLQSPIYGLNMILLTYYSANFNLWFCETLTKYRTKQRHIKQLSSSFF